jgi:hypothetical protein
MRVRRWPSLALLLGTLVALAPAAAPPDTAPPWRRMLKGEDAHRALALERQRNDRVRASKFEAALATAREVAALRERIQGKGHWQAVDARLYVRSLERSVKWGPRGPEAFRAQMSLFEQAEAASARGRHAEAEALYRNVVAARTRLFGEDDPNTIDALTELAQVVMKRGRVKEAVVLARRAVSLNQAVRGEEHPDTVLSLGRLAVLLSTAGAPAEAEGLLARARVAHRRVRGEGHPEALGLDIATANVLTAQGKHRAAEDVLRRTRDGIRALAGEDDPHFLALTDGLVVCLWAQERFKEAEVFARERLRLAQKAGAMGEGLATPRHNLANALAGQGRLREAEVLSRQALEGLSKDLGEDHFRTAIATNALAVLLDEQGKHAEAEALHRRCLLTRLAALGESHPHTASSYHNLALNLDYQSRSAEAEPLYRRALQSRLAVLPEGHPSLANTCAALAGNLDHQSRPVEAEALHRKALAIRLRHKEQRPSLASSYHALSRNLEAQGKGEAALKMAGKALALFRDALGEAHPHTSVAAHNLARLHFMQGRHLEAEKGYRQALAGFLASVGEGDLRTATCRCSLARTLLAQGKDEEAEQEARKAVAGYQSARLYVSFQGLGRVGVRFPPRNLLPVLLARRDKATEAWSALEQGLARGLLDELADRQRGLSADERRRRDDLANRLRWLGRRLEGLRDARGAEAGALRKEQQKALAGWGALEAELTGKYGPVVGQVYDLKTIQGQLPASAALVAWVDEGPEHWACVVRRRGRPVWVRLSGRGPRAAWTADDVGLAEQLRARLARPTAGKADWREPARRLFEQRLAPLAEHWRATADLPAVSHLIVLPSDRLRGVPLEALLAARPAGAAALTVSYVPSGTLFAYLQKQRALARAEPRPKLLALGDPDFAPAPEEQAPAPPEHGLLVKNLRPGGQAARAGLRAGDVLLSYAGTKVARAEDLKAALVKHARDKAGEPGLELACWRDGKALRVRVEPGPLGVVLDTRPAAEAVLARRAVEAALARSRGAGLKRLPHTRQEVRALASLFDDSTLLLGDKAAAPELDRLAGKGLLKGYRHLHLATHGFANAEQPFQSYLALADRAASSGRLSAERVREEWKLDCDLVVLSACQTGLGKYAAGEGYVGFAQAFFLAGARSLVLSQWSVDDEATALLMVRFYRNLLGKRDDKKAPMAKAEALREAKDWLRNLSAKEVKREAERVRGKGKGPVPLRKERRPFAHPYYWAAFVLVGDPS